MARAYDLVIVGLGPAGLTAARLASQELGLRVAAVDGGRIGGTNVWSGSIPSKALLEATVRHRQLAAPDPATAWEAMLAARESVHSHVSDAASVIEWGVSLHVGTAVVTGPRTVEVTSEEGTETLEGRFVLIATGSTPSVPAIPGISEVPFLTNETLYDLPSPPSDIIIIGAGPVGVESAQALARIGSQVQLYETGPRILPREEPQLSERLTEVLRNDGVDVHVGEPILAARYEDGRVFVETVRGELFADQLLVAAGRSSSVTTLGLERLGIVATSAGINVDARSRTIVTSIYAVGDAAAGRPRLTSTAVADASLAIRDMFLPGRAQASTMSPWCIFTEPELARVGFTAAQAKERFRNRAVKVHQLELSEVHRALFEGSSEGLIEIVTVHGRIVGGHVIASRASEVINEIALAVRFSVSIEELARVPHVYPTIASGIGRLASDQAVLRLRRLKGFAKLGRLTG